MYQGLVIDVTPEIFFAVLLFLLINFYHFYKYRLYKFLVVVMLVYCYLQYQKGSYCISFFKEPNMVKNENSETNISDQNHQGFKASTRINEEQEEKEISHNHSVNNHSINDQKTIFNHDHIIMAMKQYKNNSNGWISFTREELCHEMEKIRPKLYENEIILDNNILDTFRININSTQSISNSALLPWKLILIIFTILIVTALLVSFLIIILYRWISLENSCIDLKKSKTGMNDFLTFILEDYKDELNFLFENEFELFYNKKNNDNTLDDWMYKNTEIPSSTILNVPTLFIMKEEYSNKYKIALYIWARCIRMNHLIPSIHSKVVINNDQENDACVIF